MELSTTGFIIFHCLIAFTLPLYFSDASFVDRSASGRYVVNNVIGYGKQDIIGHGISFTSESAKSWRATSKLNFILVHVNFL